MYIKLLGIDLDSILIHMVIFDKIYGFNQSAARIGAYFRSKTIMMDSVNPLFCLSVVEGLVGGTENSHHCRVCKHSWSFATKVSQ